MKRFSALTRTEKGIELIRWLLVPAAAVLAVIAVALIARAVVPPAMVQPPGVPRVVPSDYQRFLLRLLHALMGAAFVITGARMAPRWRLAIAVVLALVWFGRAFMIHVWVHLPGDVHAMDFAAAVAAAGIAACAFLARRSKGAPGES